MVITKLTLRPCSLCSNSDMAFASLQFIIIIVFADICHDHRDQRWCTFSSRCTFFQREREILAPFAILLQIYSLLCFTVLFTGLNSVSVPKWTNIRYASLGRSLSSTTMINSITILSTIIISSSITALQKLARS